MNTNTYEDMIARVIKTARNSALEAAIDICRSMDGSCNECCADAIERFRAFMQDNKVTPLNS
jgi:hypothetical protein